MLLSAYCRTPRPRQLAHGRLPGRPGAGRTRGRRGGTIHHSDRSSQYASDAYQTALNKAGLRCSITEGNDCYQNALAERVNGILKHEFLFVLPDDLAQACRLVEQAVHLYNQEPPHLALNYLTPNQVHQQGKAPPENPNGFLALLLSMYSRTRHESMQPGRPV